MSLWLKKNNTTGIRGFELYRGSIENGSTFNVSGFGQPGKGPPASRVPWGGSATG